MPYIPEKERWPLIGENCNSPKTVGELNYVITSAIQDFMRENGGRNYTNINSVIGALECAKMECYRRVAAPYENGKILENGDAYDPAHVAEVVVLDREFRPKPSENLGSLSGFDVVTPQPEPLRMVGADRNDDRFTKDIPFDTEGPALTYARDDSVSLENYGDDVNRMPLDGALAQIGAKGDHH